MNFRVFCLLLMLCCGCSLQGVSAPELNRAYPDVQLFDEAGQSVSLSSFRGRTILLHAVSMGCPICQAFSGSDTYGPFGAVMPNASLSPLEFYLAKGAPEAYKNRSFQIIQVVFFNGSGEAPTVSELAEWSRHFHFHERGITVLGAPMAVSQTLGTKLVPGFQVLDKNFVLRADSTGMIPRHDFRTQLIPVLKMLAARQ
ncbi:MAG: hypothetical protein U0136_12780 [Bdellovibrionota bacterium]